mmetsp:Transcript_9024/g.28719  ORF Transcript_9024/g.28719 Transcript_9024/m.28719 type:complete len:242 (-) Transcript_9024:946-1671(-)
MLASTLALYSGLASVRRHLSFLELVALVSLACATARALAAKTSSLADSQAALLARAVTSMRLNLTTTMLSPSLMAFPRRMILCFMAASKSVSKAPLTRTNSSLTKASQFASVSPASLQVAHISAAAFTSPIFFTAAYSFCFRPLLMASFLASSRHVFKSVVQLLEGFIKTLLRLRFTMSTGSSLCSPAPSLRFFSLSRHAFLSVPAWMQPVKTSPRTSREASFSISLFCWVLCVAALPSLM